MRPRISLALVAATFLLTSSCRDYGVLGPAPLPSGPLVFTDDFNSGVDFLAFSGSKVDALSIDTDIKFRGTSSLRVRVPAPGDPSGGYAGGAFVTATPRDLSSYTALTFYARASVPVTLNVAGIGNDNTGNSLYTAERSGIALTTSWAKYSIAVPLPSKLTEERGMFFFAEGAEGSAAYDIWIDDLMYENLSTVTNPRPTVDAATVSQEIGSTQQLTGTAVTYNVDGVDQTIAAAPAYFTFVSSEPSVATVSSTGLVTVVGAGSTNITATLGTTVATGTVALTAIAPPDVAAPTPVRPADDVISLFSNAYTNVPVGTWSAEWDQADVEDVLIAGNATKKYTNLTFAGIDFGGTPIDATTMTHVHVDVWVTDPSSFSIRLVDFGANGAFGGGDDSEHAVTLNTSTTPSLTANAWSSLDIPLSAFTGLAARGHLAQILLQGASRTVYLDNLYLYADAAPPPPPAPAAPTTAAPTPAADAANVISMFSDAYTDVPVDTWRTDWSNATVIDTTIAGNATKKYSNLTVAGIETVSNQIDATAMTHFHMDIWTPDAVTGGAAFKVKLVDFGADGAFAGGDDVEHELTFTAASSPALASGSWVSLDLPLSAFTGLTTRENIAQFIIVGDDPINTVFVDNVYFYSTATSVAPTVAITSGTAGTATGPVTFTFTFSTDVGSSFTSDDIVVTGGTAGALTPVDATTYTMVVTPNANTTGTITVSVAAGTFTSVGGTANTAPATIGQAYNTTSGGGGNVVVSFDEIPAPTLSPFEGVTAASVVADPSNAANMVAMITNGVQGAANPWAGVTVSTGGEFSIPQMNVTESLTRMTARVWSPAVGLVIRAKAENALNPAQNHETNATTLTTVADAWETLTFDFSVASPLFDGLPTNPFNATDIYNKLSFFLDYGTKTNTEPRVFYIDDIRFEGTVGSALPLPPPVVAPTTLPAAPTLAAADVISLHTSSGTYTNIPVGNWNPNWGQGGSISDFDVNGGTVKFLNLVNYQGINISPDGLAAGAIDITGRNTLHISYWTADGASLVISPINADGEYAITVTPITQNGWTSLEIPINQAGFSLTSIRQLKFETTTGTGRFYLDNIYFH